MYFFWVPSNRLPLNQKQPLKVQPATLLTKTLVQVFSCQFREIFKNTFFIEHLRVTVSGKLGISFSHFHLTLDFFTLGVACRRQVLNNL